MHAEKLLWKLCWTSKLFWMQSHVCLHRVCFQNCNGRRCRQHHSAAHWRQLFPGCITCTDQATNPDSLFCPPPFISLPWKSHECCTLLIAVCIHSKYFNAIFKNSLYFSPQLVRKQWKLCEHKNFLNPCWWAASLWSSWPQALQEASFIFLNEPRPQYSRCLVSWRPVMETSAEVATCSRSLVGKVDKVQWCVSMRRGVSRQLWDFTYWRWTCEERQLSATLTAMVGKVKQISRPYNHVMQYVKQVSKIRKAG